MLRTGRKMPRKCKIQNNVKEFASHSSIHGISYIFNKKLGFLDRLLWLFVVLGSLTWALWMMNSSYAFWKDNQVITTLKTSPKPVTDLNFPAVTICANGLHMDLVEKVLFNDFMKWKSQTSLNQANSFEDQLSQFMLERFQILDKGTNILGILNTMISPETSAANEVKENHLACGKTKTNRRRRSTGQPNLKSFNFG